MSWDVEDLADSPSSQLKSEWVDFFDFFVRVTGLRIHRCHYKFFGFKDGGILKTCKCGREYIYKEKR
jgi:hypothetical protein